MQARALAELAAIVGFVEAIEGAHVGERVQCDAARKHHLVAAGLLDGVIDNVKQRILEHHLRGRRLVEALLRDLALLDVLDPENRVGIPHFVDRDRRSENFAEFGGVGVGVELAMPIRERAIEIHPPLRLKAEYLAQRRVVRIGLAVLIAVGGCTHVAAFAAEHSPAALRRADDRIEETERVKQAFVAVEFAQLAVFDDVQRDRGAIAHAVDHGDDHGFMGCG